MSIMRIYEIEKITIYGFDKKEFRFIKSFPFIEKYNIPKQAYIIKDDYMVAETEEKAIEEWNKWYHFNPIEKYDLERTRYLRDKETSEIIKVKINKIYKNELNAKIVYLTVDEMSEKLDSRQFIKYWTWNNLEYKDIFTKK